MKINKQNRITLKNQAIEKLDEHLDVFVFPLVKYKKFFINKLIPKETIQSNFYDVYKYLDETKILNTEHESLEFSYCVNTNLITNMLIRTTEHVVKLFSYTERSNLFDKFNILYMKPILHSSYSSCERVLNCNIFSHQTYLVENAITSEKFKLYFIKHNMYIRHIQ